jgi:hypothetical protein
VPVVWPSPLAVLPVIAVSRPGKTVRTDRLGLVRALHISLSRQLGNTKKDSEQCRCPGGPSQGLVADSRVRLPGVACRGFAARWGSWLREDERRGKHSVSKAAPGL